MKKRKALFLDRDGVINKDFNYVHLVENFEFIDGVFEAIREYEREGFVPIVITNQSGIGRGYYTLEEFDILTQWMLERFMEQEVNVAKVYFCPHDSNENCSCRKPMPGMIHDAELTFNLDLSNSVLVGDKESDIKAGKNAGIKTNFLIAERLPQYTEASFVVKSLFDTISFLQKGKV